MLEKNMQYFKHNVFLEESTPEATLSKLFWFFRAILLLYITLMAINCRYIMTFLRVSKNYVLFSLV
jgi:hypothetical protein